MPENKEAFGELHRGVLRLAAGLHDRPFRPEALAARGGLTIEAGRVVTAELVAMGFFEPVTKRVKRYSLYAPKCFDGYESSGYFVWLLEPTPYFVLTVDGKEESQRLASETQSTGAGQVKEDESRKLRDENVRLSGELQKLTTEHRRLLTETAVLRSEAQGLSNHVGREGISLAADACCVCGELMQMKAVYCRRCGVKKNVAHK